MAERPTRPRQRRPRPTPSGAEEFTRQVARRERRKMRARRNREQSLWFGLGMWGLVGWSVAVPTLLGVAVGVWLDAAFPGRFSWTLMLLFGGLIVGCWTAWYWVSREQRTIARSRDEEVGDD